MLARRRLAPVPAWPLVPTWRQAALLLPLAAALACATTGASLGVPGLRNGIFFFGSSGRQANPWGNGSSYQCVAPPVNSAKLQPKTEMIDPGATGRFAAKPAPFATPEIVSYD